MRTRSLCASLLVSLFIIGALGPLWLVDAGGETIPWWDGSWLARRPITVDNTGNPQNLSGYQVFVNVTYESGMNSNFSDIRFVQYLNGTGISLPYCIEDKTDGSFANVWVNVSRVGANDKTTIYLYCKNRSAKSQSNGDDTFLFFDDFGDGVYTDRWHPANASYKGTFSESGGFLTLQAQSSGPGYAILQSNKTLTGPFVSEWRFQRYGVVSGPRFIEYVDPYDEMSHHGLWYRNLGSDWAIGAVRSFAGQNEIYSFCGKADNDFHVFKGLVHNQTFQVFRGDRLYDWARNDSLALNRSVDDVQFFFDLFSHQDASDTSIYDWVRVRAYSPKEPGISVGGREYDISTRVPWWNNDWRFRQPVVIDNSGGSSDLYGYQVYLNLTYNSSMRSNFSDLRFVQYLNGTNNLLPYWIENQTNGSFADFWVNVSYIKARNITVIWAYFGNPNATDMQDGEKTFELFDDFNGAALNTSKWNTLSSPEVSSGYLVLNGSGSSGHEEIVNSNIGFGYNVSYQFKLKGINHGNGVHSEGVFRSVSSGSYWCNGQWVWVGGLDAYYGINYAVFAWSDNVGYGPNEYISPLHPMNEEYLGRINKNGTSFEGFSSNTTENWTYLASKDWSGYDLRFISCYSGAYNPSLPYFEFRYDYVFVRKYSFPEPLITAGVIQPIIPARVVDSGPRGNAAPLNAAVSITFNVSMNKSSVDNSILLTPSVPSLNYSWSADNRTVTITHVNFTENTTYDVTVPAGAASENGTPMDANFSWEFTTFILPRVIDHGPQMTDVPLNASITIAFNISMNITSVESSLEVAPAISRSFSWSPENRTVTIAHQNFTEDTAYNVTVRAGALSDRSAPMPEELSWEFRTLILPVVSSHSPTGNDEPLDTGIAVSFNVPMNRSSVEASFSSSPDFSKTLSWSGDDRTLSVSPNGVLAENATYSVTVRVGALSRAGAPLGNDFSWQFRTFLIPFVVSYGPTGQDEPLNATITISFGVSMNASSVEAALSFRPGFDWAPSWSADDRTLSVTPAGELSENTSYSVTLLGGSLAMTGARMPADHCWTFRTLLLPRVIGFAPTGNNVSLTGAQVVVRFNKPMDRPSVELAIHIEPYANLTRVSWNDDIEVVFNATFYKPVTEYRFSIGTGARDGTGIRLAAAQSFTFTTGEDKGGSSLAPRIASYSPKGTGTSLKPVITVSFDREMDTGSVLSAISFHPGVSIAGWGRFNTTYNFSLASELLPNVTYTVLVDVSARSLAGLFLAFPFSWSFATVPAGQNDSDLPVVLYTDPWNGERNVGASKVITIVFSEAMDKNSTLAAARIQPRVEGSWSWLQDNGVFLQFRSKGALATEKYTIVIDSSGARDESGNRLDGNGNGRPDGSGDDCVFGFTVGIVHSNLVYRSPEGKGVALGEPIRLRFDREMNLSSVRDCFCMAPSVNGTWTIDADGKNLTFTPEKNYRPGTRYNVTFSRPLLDRDNNPVELGTEWAFTTASPASQERTGWPWWLMVLAIILVVGVAAGAVYAGKRKKALSNVAEDTTGPSAEGIPIATILPEAPLVPAVAGECAIENVFLIYKDGRLIQHTTRRVNADMDVQVVTSMLSAVKEFVKDSFGKEDGSELGSLEYGGKKILLEKGRNIILAVEISGKEPPGLRDEMRICVKDIESEFGVVLADWNGMVSPLSEVRRFMTRLGAFKPADTDAAEKPGGKVTLKAELEFYQGFIRLKVAVKNDSPTLIADAALLLVYNKEVFRLDHIEPGYPYDDGLQFGVVKPREKKAAAFYLDPQICTESYIEGMLSYKDAEDNLETVKLKKLRAAVVCPVVYTDENINTAMLRRMAAEELDQKDTKVFSVPAMIGPQRAFEIGKAAIQHHDLRLVRELKTEEPYEAEAWYYGKAKGREDKVIVRTRVIADRNFLEFFVASTSTLMLTGMLAELKSDLNKEIDIRKVRMGMKQVTDQKEVDAVTTIRTLLEKATESEIDAGETET